jgi:hypothetical protein
MYSEFLAFYFFTNVTVYLPYSWINGNIFLSLGRSNILDGYKELNLGLCSHQCIRDVMMQKKASQ